MSHTELLIHGYCRKIEQYDDLWLVPLDIKALCCDYYGYHLCCIAFKKKKKLPPFPSPINNDMRLVWKCPQCNEINDPFLISCWLCCHPNQNKKYFWIYRNLNLDINSSPNSTNTELLQKPKPKHKSKKSINCEFHQKTMKLSSFSNVNHDIHITKALYTSIILGHVSCFQYISPKTNYPRFNDQKPLWIASKSNQPEIMKLLLSNDDEVDVNESSDDQDGLTPLMVACKYGSDLSVKVLIGLRNIEINAITPFESPIYQECTALSIACRQGNIQCIKQLLKHKDILIDEPNADGRTPLFIASFLGYIDIVRLLLSHSRRVRFRRSAHRVLGNAVININRTDHRGFSALFAAAQNGHADIIKLLIQNQVCYKYINM